MNHRDYAEGKYWARVSQDKPWWVEVRVDHDDRDGGFYSEDWSEYYGATVLELGPKILPPGHPDTPPACDLPRVLDLVAAYLAPSSPISYGRLVELLATVRGCEGYAYSDLYPRLFNVQAHPDPYPDDMALVYDCERAAVELRCELGIPELPPPAEPVECTATQAEFRADPAGTVAKIYEHGGRVTLTDEEGKAVAVISVPTKRLPEFL